MFNKIVAGTLPFAPKKFVWLFSKRYIAGELMEDALGVSRSLNQQGIFVTVDLLGEFIHTLQEAEQNKENYLEIVRRFNEEKIEGSFSIKPTSFGLLIDYDKTYEYIREVLLEASKSDNFVRIDMEDSQCTSLEIKLYMRLKEEFPKNVGLVLQAYLRRTYNDIQQLLQDSHSMQSPLNFRLCKGIYVEDEQIAYKDRHEIRHHFLKDMELMFREGIFVGIATHDSFLVNEAFELIEKHKVPKHLYEFQMLYGVTPALRDRIVSAGHNMRIYVPFGKDWFGYCSRRIKENPKMVQDIMKALFVRG